MRIPPTKSEDTFVIYFYEHYTPRWRLVILLHLMFLNLNFLLSTLALLCFTSRSFKLSGFKFRARFTREIFEDPSRRHNLRSIENYFSFFCPRIIIQLKMNNHLVISLTCCFLTFNALFVDQAVPASVDPDRSLISSPLNPDDVERPSELTSSSDADDVDSIQREPLLFPRLYQTSAIIEDTPPVVDVDESRPFRRVDRRRFRAYRGDLGKRSQVEKLNEWDAGQPSGLLMPSLEDGNRRLRQRGDFGKRRSKFRGDLGRRRSWSSPCVVDQLQEGAAALDCFRLELRAISCN